VRNAPLHSPHLRLPLLWRLWLLLPVLLPLLRGQHLHNRLSGYKGTTPPAICRLTLLTASRMDCTGGTCCSRRGPGSCGPSAVSCTLAIRCVTL